MKDKNNIKETEVSMDIDTYNKVRGKLKPTDTVSLTDKDPSSSLAEDMTFEPSSNTKMRYISNVKDKNTGDISKPFTVKGKTYQMCRAMTPTRDIVLGVYSHDEKDEDGTNIVYSTEEFEENIAKKAVEEEMKPETSSIKKPEMTEKTSPSLNLGDFKHFLVNLKKGKFRKFKNIEDLAKGNMSEEETYMNLGNFKKYFGETLFGKKEKTKLSEDDMDIEKPEVKAAIDQMVLKIKPYMDKLNQPIEKIQFIVKLTSMLQLDSSLYPKLVTALKSSSNQTFGSNNSSLSNNSVTTQTTVTNESKIITKNDLTKDLNNKRVIKTIKVKDIK